MDLISFSDRAVIIYDLTGDHFVKVNHSALTLISEISA